MTAPEKTNFTSENAKLSAFDNALSMHLDDLQHWNQSSM